MKDSKLFPIIVLVVIIAFFYSPFILRGKLPIPSDTIIGLYHPFRELYAPQYPNGIPYKNSLITDPVRQQYPWRKLSISLEKQFTLPLWNPYSFAGSPLLGNMQSAPIYPLNFLFLLLPVPIAWSFLILLQQILAAIFLFLYLDNLRLNRIASFFGAFVFSFCGFFIGWLEWGTVVQTALWLPLILLAVDKTITYSQSRKIFNKKSIIKIEKWIFWSIIFLFSMVSSFFAGHLQVFFYVFLFSVAYFFARWWQFGRSKKILLLAMLLASCFLLLTIVQWLPLLQFINLSARDVDQVNNWQKSGWFIPWQHLIQFIAPDFFGNPTTLNYWGVWNYGEFIGYVGIFPLLLGLFSMFFRHDRKTFFFGTMFFLALIFALPTWFGQLPFSLHIPFLSTAQPTRLVFIVDFCLAILAAFGFDYYLRNKYTKQILYPLGFLLLIFVFLWSYILTGYKFIYPLQPEYLSVAKHNLFLPTVFFAIILAGIIIDVTAVNKFKLSRTVVTFRNGGIVLFLILLSVVDLIRFSQKFTPFTDQTYLFPQTKSIAFLQKNIGNQRIMTTDSEILPPNFSIMYHIQTVDGYDPLYLRRYGELIAASERGKPDITVPFGFNRIITPHLYNSTITDLLGVKYMLSLSDIKSTKLTKVFTEGQTQVYENNRAFHRVFFVNNVKLLQTKQDDINQIFDKTVDLHTMATIELQKDQAISQSTNFGSGTAEIRDYQENKITIQTDNKQTGFLVLTDAYYPSWKVKICNNQEQDCHDTNIYVTDYAFRGLVVPQGEHTVIFYDTLF